jgi:hypothetical protein
MTTLLVDPVHGMKLEKKRLVTNANGVSVRRYRCADGCAALSMS